ncbi:hypothetical protein V2G26_017511 [Clonostachys chloroleuca]
MAKANGVFGVCLLALILYRAHYDCYFFFFFLHCWIVHYSPTYERKDGNGEQVSVLAFFANSFSTADWFSYISTWTEKIEHWRRKSGHALDVHAPLQAGEWSFQLTSLGIFKLRYMLFPLLHDFYI